MSPRARIVVVGLALGLALGGGLAWRWWSRPAPGVLAASGTIEATEVDASFRVGGRLLERAVDEGSAVTAGAVLARLDSPELVAEVDRLRAALQATETRIPQLRTEILLREELTRRRIEEARAALAAREHRLAELRSGARPQETERARAEVREARAVLDNARTESERLETLHRQELIAAQTRDAARMALAVAAERHRAALERLAMVEEGPRQEEIRRAEAEVRQAAAALRVAEAGELEVVLTRQQLGTAEATVARDRAALAAAEAQLGFSVLRSPLGGVVLRKHVEPGETIVAGTPVVTIADLASTWLKIYVPEPKLGHVKLGQPAEVTTDSYPGKVYRGTVTFVASEAEFTPKTVQTPEERVKLVFAVKITVANPDQELKPGMPADARLRTDGGR
jgi:HlyD family secretion protein